jgi:dihydroxyacetone kinase
MSRQPSDSDHVTGQRNDSVLANVALLYYKEGLTQSDIAKRLRVSRATVVNYLRSARERNIVDIRINGNSFASSTLTSELREKFDLRDAYIASTTPGAEEQKRQEQNRQVARVGGIALCELVREDEKLGIAWGETIHLLVQDMPLGRIPGLQVCQMIGSMESPLLPHSTAEYCAIRVANCLNADCHTLHAPAVLSTSSIAESLRAEPIIKAQLKRLKKLDRAIFSVGNCDLDTHIVQSGIAKRKDLLWYKKMGAVGVLCGRFVDEQGEAIMGELDERLIGINLSDLGKCSEGLLVVSGLEKRSAVLAALRGGYVTHLVIDEITAKSLLDD